MTNPHVPSPEAQRQMVELRAAAEKATPGPWAWESVGEKSNEWCLGVVVGADDEPLSGRVSLDDPDVVADEEVCRGEGSFENAEFIALAHPQAILALLDHVASLGAALREAEQERDELRQRLVNQARHIMRLDRPECFETAKRMPTNPDPEASR